MMKDLCSQDIDRSCNLVDKLNSQEMEKQSAETSCEPVSPSEVLRALQWESERLENRMDALREEEQSLTSDFSLLEI